MSFCVFILCSSIPPRVQKILCNRQETVGLSPQEYREFWLNSTKIAGEGTHRIDISDVLHKDFNTADSLDASYIKDHLEEYTARVNTLIKETIIPEDIIEKEYDDSDYYEAPADINSHIIHYATISVITVYQPDLSAMHEYTQGTLTDIQTLGKTVIIGYRISVKQHEKIAVNGTTEDDSISSKDYIARQDYIREIPSDVYTQLQSMEDQRKDTDENTEDSFLSIYNTPRTEGKIITVSANNVQIKLTDPVLKGLFYDEFADVDSYKLENLLDMQELQPNKNYDINKLNRYLQLQSPTIESYKKEDSHWIKHKRTNDGDLKLALRCLFDYQKLVGITEVFTVEEFQKWFGIYQVQEDTQQFGKHPNSETTSNYWSQYKHTSYQSRDPYIDRYIGLCNITYDASTDFITQLIERCFPYYKVQSNIASNTYSSIAELPDSNRYKIKLLDDGKTYGIIISTYVQEASTDDETLVGEASIKLTSFEEDLADFFEEDSLGGVYFSWFANSHPDEQARLNEIYRLAIYFYFVHTVSNEFITTKSTIDKAITTGLSKYFIDASKEERRKKALIGLTAQYGYGTLTKFYYDDQIDPREFYAGEALQAEILRFCNNFKIVSNKDKLYLAFQVKKGISDIAKEQLKTWGYLHFGMQSFTSGVDYHIEVKPTVLHWQILNRDNIQYEYAVSKDYTNCYAPLPHIPNKERLLYDYTVNVEGLLNHYQLVPVGQLQNDHPLLSIKGLDNNTDIITRNTVNTLSKSGKFALSKSLITLSENPFKILNNAVFNESNFFTKIWFIKENDNSIKKILYVKIKISLQTEEAYTILQKYQHNDDREELEEQFDDLKDEVEYTIEETSIIPTFCIPNAGVKPYATLSGSVFQSLKGEDTDEGTIGTQGTIITYDTFLCTRVELTTQSGYKVLPVNNITELKDGLQTIYQYKYAIKASSSPWGNYSKIINKMLVTYIGLKSLSNLSEMNDKQLQYLYASFTDFIYNPHINKPKKKWWQKGIFKIILIIIIILLYIYCTPCRVFLQGLFESMVGSTAIVIGVTAATILVTVWLVMTVMIWLDPAIMQNSVFASIYKVVGLAMTVLGIVGAIKQFLLKDGLKELVQQATKKFTGEALRNALTLISEKMSETSLIALLEGTTISIPQLGLTATTQGLLATVSTSIAQQFTQQFTVESIYDYMVNHINDILSGMNSILDTIREHQADKYASKNEAAQQMIADIENKTLDILAQTLGVSHMVDGITTAISAPVSVMEVARTNIVYPTGAVEKTFSAISEGGLASVKQIYKSISIFT